MDLQTLSNLFATTFNPDPDVRKVAELQIRKISNEEGMLSALLRIIASDAIDLSTRQACAVWLKNRVQNTYTLIQPDRRRPDQGPIAASDREALRINILPLIAAAPNRSITLPLANTFKVIVAHDFPASWPGLTDEIKRLINSSEIREVHAGCVAALEFVRAFRFRQKADILPQLVTDIFPSLVNVATQMLNTPPSAAQEIPTMLHLILKTYNTSIYVSLSKHQQSQESIVPWGQLLFAVVNLPLPKEAVPEDEEEREGCEWWKAKKWAYAVLGRLFHRYGNPSQLPIVMQREFMPFAKHFVSVFAPEILSTYLRQVELFVSGSAWLSKKSQYHVFTFFTECVKPKSTWTLLKPHFETLVSTFAFPPLAFNPAKQALWENDPVDYVRLSVDEYESYRSPVAAATSFLFSLSSNRTKSTFLPILGIINTVLRSNAPPPQKFGALNITAALLPWMMRHPEVKGSVEHFILQFVTPEMSSSHPYLRAVSIEVVGVATKHGLTWSTAENLNIHSRAVAAALDDPELPVRVQAALALTELISMHESVRDAVSPQVGKVIQDLVKLSDETDLDLLNNCMETMVDQFQTELLPVAAQLAARLCESYMRLARESASKEEILDAVQNLDYDVVVNDMDDDKTFAAMGVSKTITTIVASVDSSPEILAQVQEVVIPIIYFTLESKLLDLFDNMYELVDSITFKLRSISPNMWPIFELTYKLFKGDAVDFLEEMLPSLDNFLSFGSDVIKARADYKQMLVDIYVTSITNDQLGENDRVNGCRLAESILLNLRGSIDDHVQTIANAAVSIFDKCETSALRLANLEVLINIILYNPAAGLHIIEACRPGITRTFFDKWFAAIKSENRLPRVHDKKLSILTLCALLEMPPETIPESLRDGWPGMVGGILKIFKDLPKAIEDRKILETSIEEEEDDDSMDGHSLNMSENEGDVWDADSAYLEMIADENARLRAQSENTEVSDESDESDDDESAVEEELGYFSPLETVNPYSSFKQALTTFQIQNPSAYQSATTALDMEQQTLLMEVMRLADMPDEPQAQVQAQA